MAIIAKDMPGGVLWHDVYSALQAEGRVWDFKDLFCALSRYLGRRELSLRMFGTESWAEAMTRIARDWLPPVPDEYDPSTALALLDLFTTLILEANEELEGRPEDDDDDVIGQCLRHAEEIAASVKENDRENLHSRPFSRFLLAKAVVSSWQTVERGSFSGYPGTDMSMNSPLRLPVYIPQKQEKPSWTIADVETAERLNMSVSLALDVAREAEDHATEALCLRFLARHSVEGARRALLLNQLDQLYATTLGDAAGQLETVLSQYLFLPARNPAAEEDYRRRLAAFDLYNPHDPVTHGRLELLDRLSQSRSGHGEEDYKAQARALRRLAEADLRGNHESGNAATADGKGRKSDMIDVTTPDDTKLARTEGVGTARATPRAVRKFPPMDRYYAMPRPDTDGPDYVYSSDVDGDMIIDRGEEASVSIDGIEVQELKVDRAGDTDLVDPRKRERRQSIKDRSSAPRLRPATKVLSSGVRMDRRLQGSRSPSSPYLLHSPDHLDMLADTPNYARNRVLEAQSDVIAGDAEEGLRRPGLAKLENRVVERKEIHSIQADQALEPPVGARGSLRALPPPRAVLADAPDRARASPEPRIDRRKWKPRPPRRKPSQLTEAELTWTSRSLLGAGATVEDTFDTGENYDDRTVRIERRPRIVTTDPRIRTLVSDEDSNKRKPSDRVRRAPEVARKQQVEQAQNVVDNEEGRDVEITVSGDGSGSSSSDNNDWDAENRKEDGDIVLGGGDSDTTVQLTLATISPETLENEAVPNRGARDVSDDAGPDAAPPPPEPSVAIGTDHAGFVTGGDEEGVKQEEDSAGDYRKKDEKADDERDEEDDKEADNEEDNERADKGDDDEADKEDD